MAQNTYTANNNWTAPAGTTVAQVEVWAPGGGGAGANNNNKGVAGGGGGAYARSNLAVVPGTVYALTLPAGGAGGGNNANGTAGANASFGNNLVKAAGGGGATRNNGPAGAGGTTANSIGNTTYAGGAGYNVANATHPGGGGGASGGNAATGNTATSQTGATGAGGGGAGGNGGNNNTSGNAGVAPGGGGGGAGNRTSGTISGGAGGNAQAIITWTPNTAAGSWQQGFQDTSKLNGTGGTTSAATLALAVAVGDIIVFAGYHSGITVGVGTAADNLGGAIPNVYTRVQSLQETLDNGTLDVFVCFVTQAGTPTITYTPNGGLTVTYLCTFGSHYLELSATQTVASSAGQQQTTPGTGTDAITSGLASDPGVNGSLVIGFVNDTVGDNAMSGVAGTGFVIGEAIAVYTAFDESLIQASHAAVAATATDPNGATADYQTAVVVIAPSSGHTFAGSRSALASMLVSGGGAGANDWNNTVVPALQANLGNIVRTNNTTITITLPAVAGYAPSANETITASVPDYLFAAHPDANNTAAAPTFGVTH